MVFHRSQVCPRCSDAISKPHSIGIYMTVDTKGISNEKILMWPKTNLVEAEDNPDSQGRPAILSCRTQYSVPRWSMKLRFAAYESGIQNPHRLRNRKLNDSEILKLEHN